MKQVVYLVVSIDTECDKGVQWQVQRPLRFSSVTHGIPQRLMPLFERHQVKPTFLLSPEVMQDEASVEVLSVLRGCELGTHLHGEFIPPQDDPQTTRTSTPQFLYPPEIEAQKLANLTALFEDKFGYKPRSFRAGRFGVSAHTLPVLAGLGYQVDSSVSPFSTYDYDGRGERNFWGAPLQPYFPSHADLRRRGRSAVLEVPVTIVHPTLIHLPRWVLRRMSNRTRLHARLYRRLMGRSLPNALWLRPQRSSAGEMIGAAESLIRHTRRGAPVVLNMMYHSVEVVPGASPYAAMEAEVDSILESQAVLFAHLQKHYEVCSVGLGDLYPLMTEGKRASHA